MGSVTNKCQALVSNINNAISWIDQYVSEDDGKISFIRELKEKRRLVRRLTYSAENKPAVAIFGASQAGKSYLVSNICSTSTADAMEVVIGNDTVDFLEKLDPANKVESTGAVTRFTSDDFSQGEGKEVFIRLLSEIEIVKILANGYFSDIRNNRDNRITESDVRDVMTELSVLVGVDDCDGMTEDDIYDLREYLDDNFSNEYFVGAISQAGLWDELASFIPKIKSSERYKLFELFWGKISILTEVYQKLSSVLRSLDYVTEAYCGSEALIPKKIEKNKGEFISNTILDVGLFNNLIGSDPLEKITVIGKNGVRSLLSRSAVTGVISEIVLTIPSKIKEHSNRRFFKEADLLDFPGARSRNEIPVSKLENNEEDAVKEIFLRGKVAYLFDKYAYYPNDITSLILCQADNNQEVKSLPSLVGRWISKTHGAYPEDREGKPTSLFFVFTKFDKELSLKGGREEYHSAWNARLRTNLEDEMSKSVEQSWPMQWDSLGGFKNCFWVRDPNWSEHIFIENDDECKVRDEYLSVLPEQKKSFKENKFVIEHFHNPDKAWDAAATPSNTGVEYIIESFTPTCTKILKQQQVGKILAEYVNEIYGLISPFYKSGDLQKLIENAQNDSNMVIRAIIVSMQRENAFGRLLDQMLVTDSLAWQTYFNFLQDVAEDDLNEANINQSAVSEIIIDSDILTDLGIPSDDVVNSEDSKSEIYAKRLISKWQSYLKSIYQTNDKLDSTSLEKEECRKLVQGLIGTASRVNLKKIIAEQIHEFVEDDAQEGIDLIAKLSTKILNDLVLSGGWLFVDEKERPTRGGTPVFQNEVFTSPLIPEVKNSFAGNNIFNSWLASTKECYVANVKYEYDIGGIDVVANQQLGNIITALDA